MVDRKAGGKYDRAAVAIAGTAKALVANLAWNGPLLHDDAVRLAVAAMPTIAGEILADPEIMEPEEEVQ